jgi:hypothetical protein
VVEVSLCKCEAFLSSNPKTGEKEMKDTGLKWFESVLY